MRLIRVYFARPKWHWRLQAQALRGGSTREFTSSSKSVYTYIVEKDQLLTTTSSRSRQKQDSGPVSELPLAGVRVLELGQLIAGPFAGQLLG